MSQACSVSCPFRSPHLLWKLRGNDGPALEAIYVEYEGRSFTEDEERQLTREIESAANIEILCIIEKNTVTEQVHKKMLDESLEAIHEKDGQFYKGTLRGRQVLESEQSIVIIGDIEEGATVASKGNVIVTGTIYGTVIAGASGRRDAVIAALRMQPKKLRIGEVKQLGQAAR